MKVKNIISYLFHVILLVNLGLAFFQKNWYASIAWGLFYLYYWFN